MVDYFIKSSYTDTKGEVMEWMVSHQQARRNMTPGELIFANSMVADEIALENRERQLDGTYKSHESRKDGCVQMDATKDNIRDRSTNTCIQVVKMIDIKLILLMVKRLASKWTQSEKVFLFNHNGEKLD